MDIKKITDAAAADMVLKKEKAIMAVIDLPDGRLTVVDTRRFGVLTIAGDPREYFTIDGKQVLAFDPIETSLKLEGDKYVYRVTQNCRRL